MQGRGAGALAVSLMLAAASPASAADCFGIDLLTEGESVALATVTAPRAYFIENAGPSKGACPSQEEACRRKTFVVAQDRVLVRQADGPLLCATYKSSKGFETSGWLLRSQVRLDDPGASPPADWVGRWRRDREAEIELKPKGPNGLLVAGQATFGALDPQRVRRGAVNLGQIEGASTPRGSMLPVGEKYDGSKAPEEGQGFACRARLRLLGPYLAVEDNAMCGGMNVRFTGIYVRVPPAR